MMKRILISMFCILILICQTCYAAPRDEAKRLNDLYAKPIEAAMANWWFCVEDLVRERKQVGMNDVKFALYFLDYAKLTDKEITIRLEYLGKEEVSTETEHFKLMIGGMGAAAHVILEDAKNAANRDIPVERFFATLDQVLGYYANARVACDEDYMLLTNEIRPTISDR